jgi:hypothetical protein
VNKMYTIPNEEQLDILAKGHPPYMVPNPVPYIVVLEGYLNDEQCDEIIEATMVEEVYKFGKCDAITRECTRPLHDSMYPIQAICRTANDIYWQYDLHDGPGAWMQTYEVGDSYALHMDGTAGQVRKLTALALLTDSDDYQGGDLSFVLPPSELRLTRVRGTIAIFPHWVLHKVDPVLDGIRQSLNMGFWGPPFK